MASDPGNRSERVRSIIFKYARMNGKRPAICGPSRYERQVRDALDAWQHVPKMKIIYDSREKAEVAAQEMAELLGEQPQRAYACRRSKHGHHHLTSH